VSGAAIHRANSVGVIDGPSYVEHFGAGAGFWNVMRIYPEKDLGIIAMSNSTSSYRFQPVFDQLAGLDWP
jgi:hypothetical protein